MKHGHWWSMDGGLGRPSVLDETVGTLNSPAWLLHWKVFPEGIYCKEGEYIVGAGYLQVPIYMQQVFIFNHLIWWLVYLQDDLCTSQLCQTECQCSRIQWGVHVPHPLHCMIWFFLWLGFLCVGSVSHAQYKQSYIWVSILNPIFLVACSWNRLCLLVGKKVVFSPWFSAYS